MIYGIDHDAILSEVFQISDKLSELGEIVSNERLKISSRRVARGEILENKNAGENDPDLGLGVIIDMIQTVVINHS